MRRCLHTTEQTGRHYFLQFFVQDWQDFVSIKHYGLFFLGVVFFLFAFGPSFCGRQLFILFLFGFFPCGYMVAFVILEFIHNLSHFFHVFRKINEISSVSCNIGIMNFCPLGDRACGRNGDLRCGDVFRDRGGIEHGLEARDLLHHGVRFYLFRVASR